MNTDTFPPTVSRRGGGSRRRIGGGGAADKRGDAEAMPGGAGGAAAHRHRERVPVPRQRVRDAQIRDQRYQNAQEHAGIEGALCVIFLQGK